MEKRSMNAEIAQRKNGVADYNQGVGARQPSPASPAQGGGYPEIYTFSESALRPSENCAAGTPEKDPRLQQLREIGLNHIWQKVAAEIGYDNFLRMWQILDSYEEIKRPDGGILVTLRAYRSQQRYQRDRFGVLVKKQYGPSEAVRRVAEQMCEKVGGSHISRVQERFKIDR